MLPDEEESTLSLNPLPFEDLAGIPLKGMLPDKKYQIRKEKVLAEVDAWMKEHPGEYNHTIVAKMKVAGMKKPDWIPGDAWTPPRKGLEPLHHVVCYMAAWGMKPTDIGKSVGYSPGYVQDLLKQENIKLEIKQIQLKIWGMDPKKKIRSILPKAIETAELIMDDATVKASTRLAAAQDFMDRELGKSPQTLNVHDSSMRRVIEILDRVEKAARGKLGAGEQADIEDVEFEEVIESQAAPETEEPKDSVDRWIEENLCQGDSTGTSP